LLAASGTGLRSLGCRTPRAAIARELDPHQWADLFRGQQRRGVDLSGDGS